MSITIKSIYGDTLYVAETAGDVRAAVKEALADGANLTGANLDGANLARANLDGANLTRANLARANLDGANLTRANLDGANLARATGINAERVNDLLILLDQPGAIRAYKLVTSYGEGPQYGGIKYKDGCTVEVPDADTNPLHACSHGINIATLPWCLKNWRRGYRILIVEFTAADIAAIPIGDGKFRVKRCKVVGEKDLAELGLTS